MKLWVVYVNELREKAIGIFAELVNVAGEGRGIDKYDNYVECREKLRVEATRVFVIGANASDIISRAEQWENLSKQCICACRRVVLHDSSADAAPYEIFDRALRGIKEAELDFREKNPDLGSTYYSIDADGRERFVGRPIYLE